MENIFNEKTMVPVSLIITLCGAVFWISSIHNKGEATSLEVKEFKTDIKSDLRRIEGKLDRLIEAK